MIRPTKALFAEIVPASHSASLHLLSASDNVDVDIGQSWGGLYESEDRLSFKMMRIEQETGRLERKGSVEHSNNSLGPKSRAVNLAHLHTAF
jgi:hypothetical protein